VSGPIIKKRPFPAGPSKKMQEKTRENGLPGASPAGPTYSTMGGGGGSVYNTKVSVYIVKMNVLSLLSTNSPL
jgi:hypothetical protein